MGSLGKYQKFPSLGRGNPNFGHGSTEHHCSTKTMSRDYKERQVDRKKRKVFVTAHVILRTAAMFLASALNRGSYPPPPRKYRNRVTNNRREIPVANNMAPMTKH